MWEKNLARGLALLAVFCSVGEPCPAQTSAKERADFEAIEFFEKRVRPLFAQHCVGCHGPKKQQAGLRLDSSEGLAKGGESGPVIVPGQPERSLLIQVVRYDGDIQMPPDGKLPAESLAALTTWVRDGARWPRPITPADSIVDSVSSEKSHAWRRHWAFQPVAPQAPPIVSHADWPRSPIDSFLLSRMEAAGISTVRMADRRTLLRRATYDLHGLPPTLTEIATFEADPSPDAFERVLDRLLASPRYGERWGRHWLDVARYSDTKGYVRLMENRRYPSAWTYRDFVIRAFNQDLPYDQFIREQLAADQLVSPDDPRALAALGFLTLGERFINNQHDIIDDRIDVVCRGLLGLTVTCARCHDHKFDPVPTADYYSLYGVFASCLEPRVLPLILPAAERSQHTAYLTELDKRVAAFQAFLETEYQQRIQGFRERAGEYLLAGQREQVRGDFAAAMFLIDASTELNPVMVQRWARCVHAKGGAYDPVLAPWRILGGVPAEQFSPQLDEKLTKWQSTEASSSEPFNRLVVTVLAREPRPKNLAEVAERYGELFRGVYQRCAAPGSSPVTDSSQADWAEVRQCLEGPNRPLDVSLENFEDFLFVDVNVQNRYHEQQRKVEEWIASPGAPPHGQTLTDSPVLYEPRIFLRGNPASVGPSVPRQFLAVLSSENRRPFTSGSGRLELARAIASADNPLTARVLVNRVWLQHFGSALVHTPSDFGLRSESPTHPELLDYLAHRFTSDGWSLKRLHRLILTSATYQLASVEAMTNDQAPMTKQNQNLKSKFRNQNSVDPDNMLLWRANRRRLDWEAMRDSLLSVSGSLKDSQGGPPQDLFTAPYSTRRSVYGLVDRQNLAGVLRSFDFASPDFTSPQRHLTTVPQQGLFFLNSPFVANQVRRLVRRPEIEQAGKPVERIQSAYELVFGREPSPDELRWGVTFIEQAQREHKDVSTGERFSLWEEYLHVLLLSNEFVFVD
jgi:hypothetical protein